MARILRRDIRWAGLDPAKGHEQGGTRPVVIISNDVFNERTGTVIAMPVTSQPQRPRFPLTLDLESSELPKRSWVKIGQVRTLSVKRVGDILDRVSPEQMAELIEGLNEIVGG